MSREKASVFIVMLSDVEIKIALDYIYQELMSRKMGRFVIINQMESKIEARKKFDNMSRREKIKIFKQARKKIIIEKLVSQTKNSLALSKHNEGPEERIKRIRSWALSQYSKLSENQKNIFIK